MADITGVPARVLSWLSRVEGVLAVLAYSLTCLLLIGEVAMRELFGGTIAGSIRLATCSFIVASMLGYSLALGNDEHLRPAFTRKMLPFSWTDRLDGCRRRPRRVRSIDRESPTRYAGPWRRSELPVPVG